MSQDRSGAIDVGADSGDGTDDIDLTSLKEAFELPDSLPPIRLPSIAELAAQARQAPLAGQLAALAAWVGAAAGGSTRPATCRRRMPPPRPPRSASGADDFAYLWEYAIAADWLSDDDADEDRVLPGEAAEAWTDDTDEDVCFAWFVTLGAVLDETLEVAGAPGAGPRADAPAAGEDDDYDGRRTTRTTRTTRTRETSRTTTATGSRSSTSSGCRWRSPSCSSRPARRACRARS